eukprot:TRINITY_DN19365_c0_g1_i1.p1 TRINITY_DN19365_c0_g1~~TRINITY_DN19365_c0_g1_i1.p1  ORF type:complete len:150 (-),score=18.28 TRINITY_DN19365_c0_g1_i1:77-526(-)
MIKAIVIVNNHGKPRLSKFYEQMSVDKQQEVIATMFNLLANRPPTVCNFVDGSSLLGEGTKLIYRHYATLYFIFCVDSSESELAILDIIRALVESMDKCFENVCELDLIFHSDKIHYIVDELVMGGLVVNTSVQDVVTHIQAQNKLEKH